MSETERFAKNMRHFIKKEQRLIKNIGRFTFEVGAPMLEVGHCIFGKKRCVLKVERCMFEVEGGTSEVPPPLPKYPLRIHLERTQEVQKRPEPKSWPDFPPLNEQDYGTTHRGQVQ